MTVRDLIKELEEYPMDLPVVVNSQEVVQVKMCDTYYLSKFATSGYESGTVVELE